MAGALPPVIATFLGNITDLKAKTAEARADLSSTATAADADATKVEQSTSKSASSSSSAMSKLAGVGKVALVAGAAGIAAIATASVAAATSYGTLTTQLVTGAGESSKNIDMVSQGLLKMAPAVGIGPNALATAMFTVESAGYHGAAGLDVMKAAAEGAKIGGADATVVANGLTTAMTDYAIPASQAAATTSKLVETVASGKTTMGDLSGSLSNVLPAAKAAGVGLDQVLGAMATMTGEGISADQASQDLAGTIRSLQAPTATQTSAMQALGLNSLTVSNNLGKQGLTGTMDTLVTAITQHMGPAGDVIESTFKKSQTSAADAKTELNAMPASMQKIATSFMNGQLTSTQWRAAMKGMTTDQKQLAQQFATTVQSGQGFSTLIKSGGPDAETFSAALAGVTGGATGMNTALALTGSNAATFANNVKNISGATADAKGNVQGWSETTKDFGFQVDQAKAFLQAMAITIGEKLIPIITSAIKIGLAMTSWLKEHRGLVAAVAIGIAVALVPAIYAWAAGMVVAAAATIIAAAPLLLIVAAFALVAAGIYELYEHWGTIWGAIKDATSAAKNFIVGVFNDIWDFLKKWGPLILTVVAPFIGIPLLIYQYWGQITTFFENLWSDVTGAFSTALNWISNFFQSLPGKIEGWLKDAGTWLLNLGKDVINGLWNGIQDAWNREVQGWENIGSTIEGWFKDALTWLKNIGDDVINGLWNGIDDAWNREVQGWENIGSTIKGWWTGSINWLHDEAADVINGAWNGINAAWNREVSGWENIGTTIKGWFSGAANWLEQVGEDIINGIIKGIDNGLGGLESKVKSIGGDVKGWAKDALSIFSPSKVMADEVGKYIPAGIAQGINQNMGVVQTAVAGVSGAAISGVSQGASVSPALPASSGTSSGGGITLQVTVQGSIVDTKGLGDALVSAVYQMGITHGPGFVASTFSGQPTGSR